MAKPLGIESDDVPTRFAPVRRASITNEAIKTIKRMIAQGELTAGQRLPAERELAAQLGVSRPSLRECIRALIALNILESRHGEGTFVTSLDPELLAEPIDFVLGINDAAVGSLFEARQVLEGGVAALAAQRATDLELAELGDLVSASRAIMDEPDAFVESDVMFHDLIRRSARTPILGSLVTSLGAISTETRRRSVLRTAMRAQAVRDHSAIVAALKARDPERARSAMVDHLDHSREAHASDGDSVRYVSGSP